MRQAQFLIFTASATNAVIYSLVAKQFFGDLAQNTYLNCSLPQLKIGASVILLFLLVREVFSGLSVYGCLCAGLIFGGGVVHLYDWLTAGCVLDYFALGNINFDSADLFISVGLVGLAYLIFAEKLK